ncbi:helix-turn-helix domain-containing protein [Cohnella sp. CFH 77786]|uniref:AraC family transcriptional regulator n=1 Tax=Cohnella sp. CFH 77786 TaxID=2662265 RepID=UPI001C60D6D4|nr:AraC family transcriptional regulator [Cohnella sp. CFH 77786]MBW5446275.1 helix-turn-helix domain-containing protein [Cohnella sp. CFH 77786]
MRGTGGIPKEIIKHNRQYPIYIGDTAGVTSSYQKLHWHDVLEINLIKRGTGYYIINGQRIEFRQGDILLINSNDLHCAYESENLVMLVITFDKAWLLGNLRYDPEILSPFHEMGVRFANLLDRTHPTMPALRSILLQLQEEHAGESRSYASMVYAQLLLFLAHVNRDFRIQERKKPRETMSSVQLDKVRSAVQAMEERYSHPWTLEELASLVFLSPSRFSEIFRRGVGMAPMEYLIRIRLEQAMSLLETTNQKITEVALECGFRSLSNFNRLYKQHIGVPPRRTKANIFKH